MCYERPWCRPARSHCRVLDDITARACSAHLHDMPARAGRSPPGRRLAAHSFGSLSVQGSACAPKALAGGRSAQPYLELTIPSTPHLTAATTPPTCVSCQTQHACGVLAVMPSGKVPAAEFPPWVNITNDITTRTHHTRGATHINNTTTTNNLETPT